MDPFRLTTGARRAFVAVMLAGIAVLFVLPNADTAAVFANTRGELLVTPSHSRVGDVLTITVRDADVATTVLNEAEATDFTGNPYVLPPGAAGEEEIFRVQNSPLSDLDGNGAVNVQDIGVTAPGVVISWVSQETGTFALVRGVLNAVPVTFSTSYRHSLVDTVAVKVTSPSDTAGFNLVLKESGPHTQEFAATFKTGASSIVTNASDPTAVVRPVIKAVNGQLVNLEYADQSPLTIVTNSVLVDTTLPVVTIVAPASGFATRNVSEYAHATILDDGSGVEISQVLFHVDLDRDGVFDEPGETVTASPSLSTAVNLGWNAVALLPAVNTDGAVNWHVTATDRAGNLARSDSNAGATGSQDHSLTVDTTPPRPIAAYLGSSYDAANEAILTNQQKQLRVVFSETLEPASVDAMRFLIGAGNVASSGVVHEDHPDTVWLTYESLSSVVETLTVLPGAVKDAPGFPSELFFLDPVDQLGPILAVATDRAVTNGMISVDVTSEEVLGSPPSLTVNGVTYSKMIELSPKSWTLDVDAGTLAGAASGEGVKNIQIAGLDGAGNAARGGQSPEATTFPAEAVLFEMDSAIKPPVIVPGQGDIATSSNPVIVVTYADEPGEYAGDSHGSVTIISAKLDGFDVTPLLKSATSTSWIYQPSFLSHGEHDFSVQARDDAGNIHGVRLVRFTVDAPPPTAVPTPQATPVPTVFPVDDPGGEPPLDLQPEGSPTPTPTPGVSATPEPSVEPPPTATPAATQAPAATPTPGGMTNADIEATVTAMRNEDAQEEAEQEEEAVVLAADAGYTVFGCGLPAGNAVAAVGDYAFVGVGLLGLVFMKTRRRARGKRGTAIATEDDGTSDNVSV